MATPEFNQTREVNLADGSLVPESALQTSMLSIQAALEQLGPIAAFDLRELAQGRQLQPQPFGDTRSLFKGLGLAIENEDGCLVMHDVTADIVRNAVHINPEDPFDFRFTDPRLPFEGFRPTN